MLHSLSAPLQSGVRFLLPPLPPRPEALLTRGFPREEKTFPRKRKACGLTVFRRKDTLGLGSLCPPAVFVAHARRYDSPLTRCVAFWRKPDSLFGLFYITAFIESSRLLTMPSTLAPDCREAGSGVLSSQFGRPTVGRDTLSEGFRRFVALPPYLVGYCRWDGRSNHSE